MIIAGSGHRPQNAEIGKVKAFSELQSSVMTEVAKQALIVLEASLVITGGALGWDMAIARAAYSLQVPYLVYVPFLGQESKWTPEQQKKYHLMLDHAKKVKRISNGGYSAQAMQKRNEAMVDDCETLLALWDGKESGGTWNCIQYARNKPDTRNIMNVWDWYVEAANE